MIQLTECQYKAMKDAVTYRNFDGQTYLCASKPESLAGGPLMIESFDGYWRAPVELVDPAELERLKMCETRMHHAHHKCDALQADRTEERIENVRLLRVMLGQQKVMYLSIAMTCVTIASGIGMVIFGWGR